ncbi:MAG: DeoR family transcriptional regulator [Bacteroidales bacterium]
MSIKIELHENKLLQEESKRRYIARIKFEEITSLESICLNISTRCSLSTPDVEGAISALAHELLHEFAHGRSVQLGALGTFYPSLRGELVEENRKLNKRNFRINGINVHPTGKFLETLKSVKFVVVQSRKEEMPNELERAQNILKLIQTNGRVDSAQVAQINQCSKTTAVRDLNVLIKNKIVVKEKLGGGTFYSR